MEGRVCGTVLVVSEVVLQTVPKSVDQTLQESAWASVRAFELRLFTMGSAEVTDAIARSCAHALGTSGWRRWRDG